VIDSFEFFEQNWNTCEWNNFKKKIIFVVGWSTLIIYLNCWKQPSISWQHQSCSKKHHHNEMQMIVMVSIDKQPICSKDSLKINVKQIWMWLIGLFAISFLPSKLSHLGLINNHIGNYIPFMVDEGPHSISPPKSFFCIVFPLAITCKSNPSRVFLGHCVPNDCSLLWRTTIENKEQPKRLQLMG
jgi:hypothetical protein